MYLTSTLCLLRPLPATLLTLLMTKRLKQILSAALLLLLNLILVTVFKNTVDIEIKNNEWLGKAYSRHSFARLDVQVVEAFDRH